MDWWFQTKIWYALRGCFSHDEPPSFRGGQRTEEVLVLGGTAAAGGEEVDGDALREDEELQAPRESPCGVPVSFPEEAREVRSTTAEMLARPMLMVRAAKRE